jgi:hypothetical protein
MSHTKRRSTTTRLGPDWVVQDVRRYATWHEGFDVCAACGTDVDLGGAHHGMELLRTLQGEGKRGVERERLVFCAATCVAEWRRD